tara:strand:+ start:27 stop:296 length:270 start_codon:yes stop_codon:yes gene_type:complete
MKNFKIILFINVFLLMFLNSFPDLGLDGNKWNLYYGKKSWFTDYADGYIRGYIEGQRKGASYIKYLIEDGRLNLSKDPTSGYGTDYRRS